MNTGLPRLLLLTNEIRSGSSPGRFDGYARLVESGELRSVERVSHVESWDERPGEVHQRVLSAVERSDIDVVGVWTCSHYPVTPQHQEQLAYALRGKTVFYWEGDPWGPGRYPWPRGKPVTDAARWWMGRSDLVFSVAGRPQTDALIAAGAKRVHHTIHTYCHFSFGQAEDEPPPRDSRDDAVMIASNFAKIPGLTGMPGSLGRYRVARGGVRAFGRGFALYGRQGWPSSWTRGPVPFDRQVAAIREGRISVNWDHFPYHESYGSDRLAISLLAGRPHVTTAHPVMGWAPGEDAGLFQVNSPRAVIATARRLLEEDPEHTIELGNEAWRWARRRVSHREAGRFVMSHVVGSVKPLDMEPWNALPGPVGPG